MAEHPWAWVSCCALEFGQLASLVGLAYGLPAGDPLRGRACASQLGASALVPAASSAKGAWRACA
eukprot:13620318-Alexandrium_andersonii.AAC.1